MDEVAEVINFCVEIPVEPHLQSLADKLAIQENPENARGIRVRHVPHLEHDGRPHDGVRDLLDGLSTRDSPNLPTLALPVGSMWSAGRVLKVKFLPGQGSAEIRDKIKKYANQWTQFANITFKFVADNVDAEIRIGIDKSGSSWSSIGTDCLTVPAKDCTMNFGSLQGTNVSEEKFRCDVLHEFGHALGCMHEHASPAGGIPWDKPKVYEYMMRTQNWTKQQVDRNLFNRVARNAARFSSLDPKSIMFYEIPKELTLNGFSAGWNTELSAEDKSFINQVYPTGQLSRNTFDTSELYVWTSTPKLVTKRQYFSEMFNEPPRLALGLTRIDLSSTVNDRLRCQADNITENCFDVSTQTWENTAHYGSGCTWFASTPTRDSDFQVGSYSTLADHPLWTNPQTDTQRIDFDRAYAVQPCVIVWLSELDLQTGKNRRIRATATKIDLKGFTVVIETWADSTIYSATISWIAYPSDKSGVLSGYCGPNAPAGKQNADNVTFQQGVFTDPKKTPTVLIALSSMDVNPGADLRIKTWVDGVSNNGMTWHVDTWQDTVMNSATAQWIAFLQDGPAPNGRENNEDD